MSSAQSSFSFRPPPRPPSNKTTCNTHNCEKPVQSRRRTLLALTNTKKTMQTKAPPAKSLSPNGATNTYPFPVAHMSDKRPIFSKSRRFFRFWLMANWPRGRDARHGLDFEMEIRFVTMILRLFNDSMVCDDWRLSMPKCELANWLFVIFESWQGDIGVSDRTEL